MSVNRATMQGAFDLCELFQKEGVPSIIAGGAARDIYFGVTPKDIDVIICCDDKLYASSILEKAGIAHSVIHFYNESSSDRIIGVFKIAGTNIDVCLYDCTDVSEAVDAFDFNLNQFVISGIHHGIDGAHVRFVGQTHWSTLAAVRKDYSLKRLEKMQAKFLDLRDRRATGETVEVPVGGVNGPF
ncbi:hypothetical protein [Pseudomonas fildesensis]|uniref:Poly A polymerase head domain-containing protein n=2 Tax=Pseudomonas TaxID=286 RepID=A0A0J8FPF9_9PSED|nr:hypothetical protein [Pseudomonas fildesensis]KMT52115.1 hypothetical protein ACR52_28825 [Pseudomonas fildesensis]